jgi:hypothetical protein
VTQRGELTTARKLPVGAPVPHDLPEPPPPDLDPESFAEGLYVSLAPLAREDDAYGWALLILCNAIGQMFQLLDELERDTPEGPGWSLLVDLNRCPDDALPWLAQFVGVRLLPASTPDDQRARILATDGWRRGTPAALIGSTAATLTGTQRVTLLERDGGDAYALRVQTLGSETPNPATTYAAIIAQKPAGLVLVYDVMPGQSYTSLEADHASYAAVESDYATYTGALTDQHGQ